MSVLDIDAYLGKVKNRIAYVGIELEGGWNAPPPGVRIGHDASVFRGGNPKVGPNTLSGEISSPSMEPAAAALWIKKYYPDIVDKTCGLHVHMSFRTAQHYERLMVKEYHDTLLAYLAKWGEAAGVRAAHPFWGRIKGEYDTCSNNFWPDLQVTKKSKVYQHAEGSRYTVLNYCWHLHGTIECRVLPMFEQSKTAVSAVRKVIDITNATLFVLGKGNKQERVGLEVSDDAYRDRDEINEIIL